MVESQVVLTPRARKAERYATTLALIVTLGPLFYGFEGMVLNGAISAVGSEFQLGSFAKGVAGAAGIIGGLIGSLIAGRLSDYIGRRGVLLLVGPFLMFEAIFGALCPYLGGYPFLLFCRIVGGMGFGAATTVAPGYVAEISPARIRGRLISFRQLAIILGLLFAAVVNLVMTNLAGDSSAEVFLGIKAWQCMFLCLIVPALVYMILMPFIPESPRYLVSKGRNEQAAKVLERLSGTDDVTAQVESIQRSLGGVNEALGIFAVLRSKWRGLVCVGMALAAFQQTLILTVFKIIGVTAGILLVDRVGRKRMLMYGGTLIFISLAVVATVFTVAPSGPNGPDISHSPVLGFLAVAALCCFLLGFTSSWGPIFSVMMGEMFPNQIRGSAMSLASGADFFVNFLVVLLFPYVVEWSPAVAYWAFFVFGVLAVIFAKKYLHETNGKSLEEMGD